MSDTTRAVRFTQYLRSPRLRVTGLCAAIALIAGFMTLTAPAATLAADKVPAPRAVLQLIHKPLTDKMLPAPGQPLTLALELVGTREISLPVRLVAVRDGRLLPVPLLNSYRNNADHPVYEFELAAPLAELSYQFVLPSSATSVISTNRVQVRRPCVPAIDSSTAGNANQSELEKLATEARVLEQEIDAYTSALAAAEVLQKEVAE